MNAWIEKHQTSLIKFLAGIIIVLIGYIWAANITGTAQLYALMCEKQNKLEVKIDGLNETVDKQVKAMSVIIDILKTDYPDIRQDIEWRQNFEPPSYRGGSKNDSNSDK